MKTYTITKGLYLVYQTEIEAENEAQAMLEVQSEGYQEWERVGQNMEKPVYQVEDLQG